MPVLITDPDLESHLIAQRQEAQADSHDEVWNGVYVMAPLPNDQHQELQAEFLIALKGILGSKAKIRAGVNVSDRVENWKENYRCPDVVAYLPDNPAKNYETHWQGGPDFLVEVVSRYDRSHDKIPFYSLVNVREALFINRHPWSLDLYAKNASSDELKLVGTSFVAQEAVLQSTIMPATFKLIEGENRPMIEIASTIEPGKTWLV